jgi:hypothetical protein
MNSSCGLTRRSPFEFSVGTGVRDHHRDEERHRELREGPSRYLGKDFALHTEVSKYLHRYLLIPTTGSQGSLLRAEVTLHVLQPFSLHSMELAGADEPCFLDGTLKSCVVYS